VHITSTGEMEWTPTKNTRHGRTYSKRIRESEVAPGIEHYTRLVKYESGDGVFEAPRHKHNFDQLRVGLSGEQDFGRGLVCPAGTVAYFPEGAPYGPERIEDAEVLVLQWGQRWVSKAKNDAAIDSLAERGSFEGGMYRSTDPSGATIQRDSITAVWEEVYGTPLVYPQPRYSHPILMHPEAYGWTDPGTGVQEKLLGRFSEVDLLVGLVKWDREADLRLPETRTQMLFSLEGVVEAEDSEWHPCSALWSDVGEVSVLRGRPGAVGLMVGFPPRSPTSFLFDGVGEYAEPELTAAP
jgi:hypothetical protein